MANLKTKLEALPRRIEPISGQNFSYVKLEDVLGVVDTHHNAEGDQISALRAKVVKFISKNDPFGDVFSQHELAQLEGCDINRVKEVTPMSAFEIIPDAYGIMDGDSTRCAVRRGTMGETSGLLYIDTGSRFVRIYEIEPNRFKDADERMWTIFFTPSEQISGEAEGEPKGHWQDGGKVWVEDHDCSLPEAREAAIRECITLIECVEPVNAYEAVGLRLAISQLRALLTEGEAR